MTPRCRFLTEVVLANADFLPEGLRTVLRDFAYAYMPYAYMPRGRYPEDCITWRFEDEEVENDNDV